VRCDRSEEGKGKTGQNRKVQLKRRAKRKGGGKGMHRDTAGGIGGRCMGKGGGKGARSLVI